MATIYYKIIGGQQVLSYCKSIQMPGGEWVSNPSAEQIAAAGWQVYVPPVVPPQPATEPGYGAILDAVKRMLSTETEELTDEEALAVAALFPTWASKIEEAVAVGDRLWYDGKLWKVIQAHTAASEWTPDTAVSLFVEVSIEEWPEWRQPVGSEDAYALGAHVSHNGSHWESTIPANVYEPGVYGWTEV